MYSWTTYRIFTGVSTTLGNIPSEVFREELCIIEIEFLKRGRRFSCRQFSVNNEEVLVKLDFIKFFHFFNWMQQILLRVVWWRKCEMLTFVEQMRQHNRLFSNFSSISLIFELIKSIFIPFQLFYLFFLSLSLSFLLLFNASNFWIYVTFACMCVS